MDYAEKRLDFILFNLINPINLLQSHQSFLTTFGFNEF